MQVLTLIRMTLSRKPDMYSGAVIWNSSKEASIVCYAVYRTGSVPCHELVKGYKSDPGVGHWTTVKIILSGIRICFSVMEVTKSSS